MAVDHRSRDAERLESPLARVSSGPAHQLCGRDVGDQPPSDVVRTGSEPLDEFHIPRPVQRGMWNPGRTHPAEISAAIMVIARVQRLMDVSDEMQQELQGDTLLCLARTAHAQLARELLDLV